MSELDDQTLIKALVHDARVKAGEVDREPQVQLELVAELLGIAQGLLDGTASNEDREAAGRLVDISISGLYLASSE